MDRQDVQDGMLPKHSQNVIQESGLQISDEFRRSIDAFHSELSNQQVESTIIL